MTRWLVGPGCLAAVATSLLLAVPSPAVAGDHAYCGAPNYVYPGYPCYSGEAHTYDANSTSYSGTGSFSYCEELYYGSLVYSDNCWYGNSIVYGYCDDSGLAPYPNNNTFMHDIVVNQDNNRHTLQGHSWW